MSSRVAATLWSVAVVALLAAGAGIFMVLPRRADAPPTIQAFVGGARLTLPGGYFRPKSRGGGVVDQLALAAFFPDFSPAGDVSDVARDTNLDERFERLVFISIRPRDSGLDPVDRPARLYARFLEPDGWSHPGGLVARAFQAGSPFEGQELYFVAPEGREFAARCRLPDQAQKTPNTCLYDFRVGDLDVQMRFSAALLSEWEKLNAGARGLIETAGR
ncbi:MAG: hypothetical protein ACLQJL_06575 [Roseiarcus sp.]